MQATEPGNGGTGLTRRSFLETSALGALAAAGASTSANAQAETYRFGGEVVAWHGREPSSIANTDNPTLQLEPGQQYRVVWENLDGQPHNFTIRDDQGNELESTETTSEEGATLSLTFTATPEMSDYICTVHPTTMIGDIQMPGGGGGGDGDGGGNGIPTDAYFFAGAVLLAFVSPLLFAIVLLFVGTGDRGPPGE
ncbi:cupredoxin domain-containing protein [Halomicrococcus sp. SG-WS-1]|uniref:cupredoxin domain-containing protein n=1 Tax=Halomicrococcus sp. SG-WS-1 TaxID=3439057 RepID=UPI003F7959CE